MKNRITEHEMIEVINNAKIQTNILNSDDHTILFYDLTYLQERIKKLVNSFPKTTLHAIAIKANPLIKILQEIRNYGVGLEAASLPELFIANKCGYLSKNIVFDSPAKTIDEIEYALKLGVHINANSFTELDRISELLKKVKSKSTFGIRINPQIGVGNIISTSVSDVISKFGVPLDENRNRLKTVYDKFEWLQGCHIHIGSQGYPVDMLVSGIEKVKKFVDEVNLEFKKKLSSRRINIFDIGGGLPVSYHKNNVATSIDEFYEMLKDRCTDLFTKKFKLITEFGRYVFANTGWVASRVEYVIRYKDYNIAVIHVGGDMFLRECYNPKDWHHEITIINKYGKLKKGQDKNKYIIAGPLCFSGDVLAKNITLPVVEEGDYVLIHDTGAYTLSMWSRYNSKVIPKVLGYNECGKDFNVIKEKEQENNLFEFWS